MFNLSNCPVCKGTGKQTVSFQVYGSKKPPTISEQDCCVCEGKAKLTPQEALETQQLIDYEKQLWCKCGNPSKQSKYHKDGNKIVGKHCWTCKDCGKVTQIG